MTTRRLFGLGPKKPASSAESAASAASLPSRAASFKKRISGLFSNYNGCRDIPVPPAPPAAAAAAPMGACSSKSKGATLSPTASFDESRSQQQQPDPEDAVRRLFEDAFRREATTAISIKDLERALRIPPNNLWLPQFGHLCDKASSGAQIRFMEFVYVLGALSQKGHESPKHAELELMWRLMDLEGAGRMTRNEAVTRFKAIYKGFQNAEEAIFQITQKLPVTSVDKSTMVQLNQALGGQLAADMQRLHAALQAYGEGCVRLLASVCKELGAPNLNFRVLRSQPMHLDVADVAALIELEDRTHALSVQSKEAGVPAAAARSGFPEMMLGAVCEAFKECMEEAQHSVAGMPGHNHKGTAKNHSGGSNPEVSRTLSIASTPPLRAREKRMAVGGDGVEHVQIVEHAKSEETRQMLCNAIEDCLLFEDMEEQVFETLIGSMFKQTAATGTEIMRQGDTDTEYMYVMESGVCGVFFTDEDKKTKRVNTKTRGMRFGELALLYASARSATVVVEEDAEMWVLDRKAYTAVNVQHLQKIQKRKEDLVDNVAIFQWLQKEMRQQLVDAMIPQEFPAGRVIMKKGDIGDVFYIIDKGEMAVFDGDVQLVTLGPGASFGERALLADDTRTATVKALTPSSCLVLQRKTIVQLLGPLEDVQRWCLLRKSPAMSFLSDEQVNVLVAQLTIQTLEPNEFLFEQSDPADSVYIVYSGEVKLIDEKAKQDVVRMRRGSTWRNTGELARCAKGDLVGEEAFVSATSLRTLSAQASEVGASLLRLGTQTVTNCIGSLDELQIAWRMNIVKKIPLLAPLSGYDQKKIVDGMEVEQCEDGCVLAAEGDEESRFFLVQFGTVACTRNDKEIKRLRPGQYFGESSVIGLETTDTYTCIGSAVVASVPPEVMMQFGDTVKQLLADGKVKEDGGTEKLKLKDLSGVKKLKLIGVGGFGQVHLVRIESKTYAMKMLLKDHVLGCKMVAQVNAEREIGMQCDNPFLVNLYGTYRDSRYLYMFMEPVIGGELFSFVENHRTGSKGVDENQSKFFAACVILGLEYLHNQGFVYRDIKLENLLIDHKGYVKIADFGFAKRVEGKTYTVCGTPEYMAPEIITRKGHGKSVDVWALGVMIFELVCRWTPFSRAGDDMAVMNLIKKGEFTCPSYMSKECTDLVKQMLQVNVAERLGCLKGGLNDLKRHAWFDTIDWDKLSRHELQAPWVPKLKSDEDCSNLDTFDASTPHPGSKAARQRRNSGGVFNHW